MQYRVNLQQDIRVSTSTGDTRTPQRSCHKGTYSSPCKLVFFQTLVIITGFESVKLMLGHSNNIKLGIETQQINGFISNN